MNYLTHTISVLVVCGFIAVPVGILAGEVEQTVQENLARLIETKSCRDCNLQGVNLNRADLSGGDLQGADLTGAKLYLCNLSGANLRDSILRNTGFGGADLAHADLRGADLTGTSLAGAYTTGTKFDNQDVVTDEEDIDLESILDEGRSDSPLAAVEYSEIENDITESISEQSFNDPVMDPSDPQLNVVKTLGKGTSLVTASKVTPKPKRVVPIQRIDINGLTQ